jgi:hypothetical protein
VPLFASLLAQRAELSPPERITPSSFAGSDGLARIPSLDTSLPVNGANCPDWTGSRRCANCAKRSANSARQPNWTDNGWPIQGRAPESNESGLVLGPSYGCSAKPPQAGVAAWQESLLNERKVCYRATSVGYRRTPIIHGSIDDLSRGRHALG